ncbi:hypothetical protein DFJ58DRAFT_776452 [Suillus subalutaceus]|uniref:uncharacterized protein n=1 Tax=Suillus subalutaceus TaxID=48586 RepID=UPI001B87EA75|nr:uncharacterized protein DFJ58DRAFT_776452 [Suillus subalutaceus]KAG1862099.1 hypothetical protein DFJ58DRAFT_776452 [Suillus subalutaceus]
MSGVNQTSAKAATTATFVTALVFNAAVFGIEIALFTILRPYFKQIYEPRTQFLVEKDRVKPFEAGFLTWPITLFKTDYRDVQQVNGPDAYLFVRFLRMMIRVLLPIWFISWIVLMPVTSVNNSVPNSTGLDRFIFGNASDQPDRYAAHIILVYLFTFWIYWNIRREMKHFTTVRQLHLVNPAHSRSVQANTILVTGIPARHLSESALRQLYSHLPGGVKKVWLNRDLKELPSIYDRRLAACGKLESAETSLLSTAAKIRRKALKEANGAGDPSPPVDPERNVTLAERLVPRDQRPSHRLPAGFMPFSLPLIGEKVDTIDWCRQEIAASTGLLTKGRQTLADQDLSLPEDANGDGKVDKNDRAKQTYPPLSSAFITFNQQIAAHLAANALTHHEPYCMADRYLEVSPPDVIWGNLGLNPYEKRIRVVISYSATAALIIFWAIPVAFVGIISNIEGLCVRESWLAWLCKLPSPVIGIIQGILPPVLLAVLMMLLPIILRLFGRFEGIPTRTGLELSLMTRYFIFQVIHSFLIVTLASGVFAALPSILANPSSIAGLLAQYLPQASTFFLTYILLQGLTGVAGGFLNIVALALYYVKLFLLGSTPRSIYNIKYGQATVAWGTLFPSITLLVVITFAYSIISPVINGLACATFFLFYLLYKYLFLYKYTQPPSADTGGLFFPKAIQHVFVGMYVQQLCLCALFFLVQDPDGKRGALPEGVLMVVLIILTVGYHAIINSSFGPLTKAFPLSLAHKTFRHPEPSLDIQDVDGGSGSKRKEMAEEEIEEGRSPTDEPRASSSESGAEHAPHSDYDDVFFERGPDGSEDYGFAQPAACLPQRIVWIPDDSLSLGREEVQTNKESGVKATTQNATMDEHGNVDVTSPPVDLAKF